MTKYRSPRTNRDRLRESLNVPDARERGPSADADEFDGDTAPDEKPNARADAERAETIRVRNSNERVEAFKASNRALRAQTSDEQYRDWAGWIKAGLADGVDGCTLASVARVLTMPEPRSAPDVAVEPPKPVRDDGRPRKTCSDCGRLLLFSQFYKNKLSKDGYRSECKACTAERYRPVQRYKGKGELKRLKGSKNQKTKASGESADSA